MKTLLIAVKNDLDQVIDLHKIFDDYPQLNTLGIVAYTECEEYEDFDIITRITTLTINETELNITGFELNEEDADKLPDWLVDQDIEDLLNALYPIVEMESDGGSGEGIMEYTRQEVESAYNIVEMCAQLRTAIDNFTAK